MENGLFKARLIHEIWTETGVISKIAWLVTNRFTEIGLTAKAEAILMKLRQGWYNGSQHSAAATIKFPLSRHHYKVERKQLPGTDKIRT